jgi:hypothetical protein
VIKLQGLFVFQSRIMYRYDYILSHATAKVSYSPAPHHSTPGSIPGQFIWDLWWTWHADQLFLSILVSLANFHLSTGVGKMGHL